MNYTLSLKACIAVIALCCSAPAAASPCRHALVLALDVSGSVNDEEYRLQIDGLAAALLAPKVQSLILSKPSTPISLAIFEWSEETHQKLIVDWTELTSPAILNAIATRLQNHSKDRATLKTAIGSALSYAKALLDQKKSCLLRTIDLSGDGINNDGKTPGETYTDLQFGNIVVNGLAISIYPIGDAENPVYLGQKSLQNYFDTEVIRGPKAFTIRAQGYKDYKNAMTRKLIKELSPEDVSDNGHNHMKNTSGPFNKLLYDRRG